MSPRDLPAVNALLNASSALLLLLGWALIRAGKRQAHRVAMLAALACSTLFLASYLYYHFGVQLHQVYKGPARPLYLGILLTHTVLAIAIVPLVGVTLTRALRERFDTHRRIARITLPLWAYVSVTGVVIYWMLYRL
jgi:uncharacterized membrane protein YozB (DUF420 family)